MIARVEKIKPEIVRRCREQIGLSQEAVVRKEVKSIADIEAGKQKPTFKQLDILASLFKVPRWVLISDKLPKEYQFDQTLAFRKFSQSGHETFDEHKTRSMLVRVEKLSSLMIELRESQNNPVGEFSPPGFNANTPPDKVAELTRDWLGVTDESFELPRWRKEVESKGVFIFMTSKYQGWSHVGRAFRGLAIYRPHLPIIVINDSDARKAQSFTLFHELGHILKRQTRIDEEKTPDRQEERWCNQFAGCVLMPEEKFRHFADKFSISRAPGIDLDDVKEVAKKFQASIYACIMRMEQLKMISKGDHARLLAVLKKQHEENREKMKNARIKRRRPKEIIDQYGESFSRTIAQAHFDREIGLHKLCHIFSLRRASLALEVLEELK